MRAAAVRPALAGVGKAHSDGVRGYRPGFGFDP